MTRLRPTNIARAPETNTDAVEHRRQLAQIGNQAWERGLDALPKDGSEPMEGALPFQSLLNAEKPAAGNYAGEVIYVSDLGAHEFWDGTQWVPLTGGQGLVFQGTWDPSVNGGGLVPSIQNGDGRLPVGAFWVATTGAQYNMATGQTGSGAVWAVGDWAVKDATDSYIQLAVGANVQGIVGDTGAATSVPVPAVRGAAGIDTASDANGVDVKGTNLLTELASAGGTAALVKAKAGQLGQVKGLSSDATLALVQRTDEVELQGAYATRNDGAGAQVLKTIAVNEIPARSIESTDANLTVAQLADVIQLGLQSRLPYAGEMYLDGTHTQTLTGSAGTWQKLNSFDTVNINDGVTVDAGADRIIVTNPGRYQVGYGITAKYAKKDNFIAFALYVSLLGDIAEGTESGFSQTVEEEESFSNASSNLIVDVDVLDVPVTLELWARRPVKDSDTLTVLNVVMWVAELGRRLGP